MQRPVKLRECLKGLPIGFFIPYPSSLLDWRGLHRSPLTASSRQSSVGYRKSSCLPRKQRIAGCPSLCGADTTHSMPNREGLSLLVWRVGTLTRRSSLTIPQKAHIHGPSFPPEGNETWGRRFPSFNHSPSFPSFSRVYLSPPLTSHIHYLLFFYHPLSSSKPADSGGYGLS